MTGVDSTDFHDATITIKCSALFTGRRLLKVGELISISLGLRYVNVVK